jgi:hypothetical protein
MSALMSQARTLPRIAEAARERARLTVVPRRTRRAARAPFVTLVTLLLVLGVAGLLFFNTSMQQSSFTATAMEERASVLDAREQALQMRLAVLRDPQRVAERAQHLGMVPPASPAFIRLSDGKVLGNPQPATSLDRVRIAPLPAAKPANLRPGTVTLPAPAAEQAVAAQKKKSAHGSHGAAAADRGAAAGTKAHGKKR